MCVCVRACARALSHQGRGARSHGVHGPRLPSPGRLGMESDGRQREGDGRRERATAGERGRQRGHGPLASLQEDRLPGSSPRSALPEGKRRGESHRGQTRIYGAFGGPLRACAGGKRAEPPLVATRRLAARGLTVRRVCAADAIMEPGRVSMGRERGAGARGGACGEGGFLTALLWRRGRDFRRRRRRGRVGGADERKKKKREREKEKGNREGLTKERRRREKERERKGIGRG